MDLKKYIYGHCVYPVRIKVWDALNMCYVVREVPCGKCLHCRNTHINEWCTRLIAQRLYSNYCYYVSLDYAPFEESDSISMQLARETAACYNACNKNKHYALHPLVLCKNHLQDFYKRLRKNTGVKLQYFACGEYGMHANGTGYGRPHYHNIIFSNDPISIADYEAAWSVAGYKIGRVDFVDMNTISTDFNEQLKIFKYVCKYLQKSDFDFEKLATIDYHRAYFKSMQYVLKNADTLFPESVPIEDRTTLEFNWREYTKLHAPFIVCSRRPSIGSQYFADNVERFKEQDFRLFGLPKECTTVPRYYVRRTKELIYGVSAIGSVSKKPSSSSRMGHILQILSILYNDRVSLDSWGETACRPWCLNKSEDGLTITSKSLVHSVPCSDLSFYDSVNKFLYQFDGYAYKVWYKLKGVCAQIDYMDIYEVIHEFAPSWDRYAKSFLQKQANMRILREHELVDTIECLYKGQTYQDKFEQFRNEVYAYYKTELDGLYKTKLLMQNSKQTL